MHKIVQTAVLAGVVALFSVSVVPKQAVAAGATQSSCQWQYLYSENIGNPSQYGTVIDWYGAVGQCQYSKKGYNRRNGNWIYL